MIGFITAIVGEVAGLIGCVVGIPASINAITLVAIGTSLPDTFASMTAA
jgi:solute carrier family 8 (sodium/calcium exchanger)